jgi:hypothetical protein
MERKMIRTDWTYIICSKRFEKERYDNWLLWLNNNNIKGSIEFYKWGTELSNEDIRKYVVRDGTLEILYPWRSGYPIRDSEASIAINFLKIFEDAYHKNYEEILVLESDVLLHPDFISITNGILEVAKSEDFNCISLGFGMGMRLKNDYDKVILAKVDQFRCADSLIFNRTAIKYFYNNLKQIRLPIDEEFTQAVKNNNISVYWLDPPIAVQGSQIGANSSSVQFGNPYNLQIPWL